MGEKVVGRKKDGGRDHRIDVMEKQNRRRKVGRKKKKDGRKRE